MSHGGKGITREFIVIHLRVGDPLPALSPIEKKRFVPDRGISMKNRILLCELEDGQDPFLDSEELPAPALQG